MSRGRRYSNEPKLNIKKVIAVIMALAIIVLFIVAITKLLKSDKKIITANTYFSVYTNNKWGVIDNNANIVIEPTYDEMIIIPDNKKDVFICTENVDYTNNTYNTKVLNSKNKQILDQYGKVEPIENYDEYKNLWYEKNLLKFQKDEKYGLIDLNGKILLDAIYDDIYSLKGTKDVVITVQDKKLGLVNSEGTIVIPNKYTQIKSLGEDTNLYIVQDENGKYGIYNKTENKYQDIKQIENKEWFCVKENDKYKIINQNEETTVDLEFDDVKQIKNNVIVYTKNKKYGAYNIETKKEIDCKYNELKYTCENNFIAKSGNSYGIIDIENNVKLKLEYANIQYYEKAQIYEVEEKNNTSSEESILNKDLKEIAKGIVNEVNSDKSYIKLWTEEGYKYYSLSGEEKASKEILTNNNIFLKKENGKYGFVDKDGKTVTDCIYDDAKEQNEYGYAAVKKNGKWGAINSNGDIVCEINYNLDENLLIDFIGKYHLAKDINLLAYTDNQ